MAHTREPRREPACGLVRDRGRACGRGDDDAGHLPVARLPAVVVYHAPDCSLCARALAVVTELHAELGFELALVDVSGDPVLEAEYREHLPVVAIDGERAFTYFVDPVALRERLS